MRKMSLVRCGCGIKKSGRSRRKPSLCRNCHVEVHHVGVMYFAICVGGWWKNGFAVPALIWVYSKDMRIV